MSARRVALLVATLCLCVSNDDAYAGHDTRLVLGFAILPQFEQFVGDNALPVELYRAELAVPFDRRSRAGVEVAYRRDFSIIGAALHYDVWRSERNEWRVAAGLGYVVPFGDSETIFERHAGESSSLLDRLHLRLGLGQTFDLQRGGVALRVAYDARVVFRDSVLSVLEALDDGVDEKGTFLVHELTAGVELRLGGGE